MEDEHVGENIVEASVKEVEEPATGPMEILLQFMVAWHPDRDMNGPIDYAKDDFGLLLRFPGGAMRCLATASEGDMSVWLEAHGNIVTGIEQAHGMVFGTEGA